MGQQTSKKSVQARVLMLGLDGAGKSTILYKLKHNRAVTTVPTIGFNIETIETKKRPAALTVWDVGGQQKMRPHWKHYYQDTAGFVFVVDSSERARLDEAKKEFDHVLKSEFLKGLPVVIFVNKQDLPGVLTVTDITERFNLRRTCSTRDWFVQPCSATVGMGLQEGFERLAHLVKISSDNSMRETVKYLRSRSIMPK